MEKGSEDLEEVQEDFITLVQDFPFSRGCGDEYDDIILASKLQFVFNGNITKATNYLNKFFRIETVQI